MATAKYNQNQVRYDKKIYLMTKTIVEDEIGNQVSAWAEKMTYAREVNVSSEEFYNAAVTGLRPETQFEIYKALYNGAEKVKYQGLIYSIIRTKNNGDKLILTCEKVAADG
ncbi:phage head closure protein [Anaerosolibacter sp.]|uniref:phage head closure protein n=1 Tax=Anaerosolibacter sp. TaxID=1872527 RepID=UPI0039F05C1F